MAESSDSQKKNDAKRALSRLEEQLLDIESAEIVHGMSQRVLEEKGFLGEKAIEIQKTQDTPEAKPDADGLIFKANIVCTRLPPGTLLESLTCNQFKGHACVQKDQPIAFKPAKSKTRYNSGANVVTLQTDKGEAYVAGAAGWVVILDEIVCVFPCDRDCCVEVHVSKDRLCATVDIMPGNGLGRQLSKELVVAMLIKAGVTFGISDADLLTAIDVANRTGVTQRNIVAAKAKPPIRGSDGHLDLKFSMQQEYDFKILPDGRIDYKSSVNIVTVKKNDLLAVLSPPVQAVPGTDVFGNPIPILPSKDALCIPGDGVRAENQGREFYADTQGLVMFQNNLLEVLEVYHVNSNVDFSTGNITFTGSIIINGDIKEGFDVKATGDIVVRGNVESARVEAGRDVVIKGGVVSKGKGLVTAGRNFSADYVQNARVEAQGDVIIGNFAVNSYVCTSRHCIMQTKRGAIIGGEVYAQKGIDVRVLGSDAGIKTFVEVGTDFLVRKKIVELEEVIKFTKDNMQKIDFTLRPVLELAKTQPGAVREKKDLIEKIVDKKKGLEKQLACMAAKMSVLEELMVDKDTSTIKVKDVCHSDVSVKVREARMTLTKSLARVIFYEDTENKELKTMPYG